MRNFFEHGMSTWPQLTDALHIYALPDDALRTALDRFQEPIAGFAACAVQPGPFLHATVSRLPAFRTDLDADGLDGVRDAIATSVAGVAPFELEFGRPRVNDSGVLVECPATPGWDALVDAVRSVAATLTTGLSMPRRPHAPHVSLGYAVGDGDNAELAALLDAVPDGEPLRLRVDAAHLLSVHQDPDAGVFTWDPVAVAPLHGAG